MEIKYREKTIEYLKSKEKYDATDLELIVALLRSEGGCPWDMEQTHESIRGDLIEVGVHLSVIVAADLKGKFFLVDLFRSDHAHTVLLTYLV